MKTVYIYLSRNTYTEEHINFMLGMLTCLNDATRLCDMVKHEREDLYSVEVKVSATPWAMEFLEHMSECDMLCALEEPIEAK